MFQIVDQSENIQNMLNHLNILLTTELIKHQNYMMILKKTETLKFLIKKDILKYINMLNKGDKKLMRVLNRNCLFYNYPYDNWINFAQAFSIAV